MYFELFLFISVFLFFLCLLFTTSDVTFNASDVTFNASDVTFNASDVTFNASDVPFNASDVPVTAPDVAVTAPNVAVTAPNVPPRLSVRPLGAVRRAYKEACPLGKLWHSFKLCHSWQRVISFLFRYVWKPR